MTPVKAYAELHALIEAQGGRLKIPFDSRIINPLADDADADYYGMTVQLKTTTVENWIPDGAVAIGILGYGNVIKEQFIPLWLEIVKTVIAFKGGAA